MKTRLSNLLRAHEIAVGATADGGLVIPAESLRELYHALRPAPLAKDSPEAANFVRMIGGGEPLEPIEALLLGR